MKKSNDTFYHIGLEKKAGNWTWVSGRQLNFPQWINNLSSPDREVASISCKFRARDYVFKLARIDVTRKNSIQVFYSFWNFH